MIEYAKGIDTSKVISKNGKNKCISLSETLETDTNDLTFLKKKLLLMCEEIGMKLRLANLYAKTIAITVKTNYFKDYSHQKKIVNQTNNTMELYQNVLDILEITIGNNLVRNIGVRVSDFVNYKNSQVSLFEDFENLVDNDKIQKTLDNINKKYDELKVLPAVFYNKENKKE